MTLKNLMKSWFLAVIVTASLLVSPALAAGTTPLALVPQVDNAGNVAAGCVLYIYQAGTVSVPQNSYYDFALTQPQPSPLPCSQSGRVPMHWLADGLVHIRLLDAGGVPIVDTTLQTLGPSGGGGGGGSTVDPTTVLATGDLKTKYGTGPISGFVRLNGLTIGSSVSGATERANADTQALFIYLYSADANLAVSGGRTGNALNDFNANKTITLPDGRGRVLAALDDMGNSAAGRLTASYFGSTSVGGCVATTLGCAGGNESQTLALAQLPTITSSNLSQAITVLSNGSIVVANPGNIGGFLNGSSGTPFSAFAPGTVGAGVQTSTGNNSISTTSNNTLGQAHPIVQPILLITNYMKL